MNKILVNDTKLLVNPLVNIMQRCIPLIFVIKKVHLNMCPILDGYGVMGIFKFPSTPSCEPCLRKQLAGDVLSLVAYRLLCKHYYCHLTRPPSYRQSSFRITTLGRYLRNAVKVGRVGNSPCQCILPDSATTTCSKTRITYITMYTAWLCYYYVFKNPYHLHYSDRAGYRCSEQ
jgi:hypothetical protein